jgi:Bacteriophage replication gene A protein (GPA)
VGFASATAEEYFRRNLAEAKRYQAWARSRVARDVTRIRDYHLQSLPFGIAQELLKIWDAIVDTRGYPAANEWIAAQTLELKGSHVHEAFDNSAIVEAAQRLARRTSKCTTVKAAIRCVQGYGLTGPKAPRMTNESAMKRMRDPRWISRQMRHTWTRHCEHIHRSYGLIREGRSPYSTRNAQRYRRQQRRAQNAWLKHSYAVSDKGQQLNLFEVREHSLANPAIRRMELMVRVRGFEETAKFYGHCAVFATLTTPSRFHAQLERGGANPRYQRATIREAQKWLRDMFSRVRSAFKNRAILFYGFRVAEPHHDGTPHWHLLLFVRAHDKDTVTRLIRGIFLSDAGDDPGAQERRVQFEQIESAKGSATGYIAKYISKNIDGHGSIGEANDNETGRTIAAGVRGVDAWASINGIRQFQQFGGPPVGLWRELRRLRNPVDDPDIERCRIAADRNSWRDFTHAVGGITAGRRTNLRLERVETGRTNFYSEPRGTRIIGVRYASTVVITRPDEWHLVHRFNPATDKLPVRAVRTVRTVIDTGPREEQEAEKEYFGFGPGANEPRGWTNPHETSMYGP